MLHWVAIVAMLGAKERFNGKESHQSMGGSYLIGMVLSRFLPLPV
jgi:hypothetical protein